MHQRRVTLAHKGEVGLECDKLEQGVLLLRQRQGSCSFDQESKHSGRWECMVAARAGRHIARVGRALNGLRTERMAWKRLVGATEPGPNAAARTATHAANCRGGGC